jgi:hypothetical protein
MAANLLDALWDRRAIFPPLVAGLLGTLPVLGMVELVLDSRALEIERESSSKVLASSKDAYSNLTASVQNPVVFQLPHVPFPEHPDVERMKDYDHFIPTLLGQEAKWSYGNVRFSADSTNCTFPSIDFVNCAQELRFNTIWIDTYGYVDGGLGALRLLQEMEPKIQVIYENERYILLRL